MIIKLNKYIGYERGGSAKLARLLGVQQTQVWRYQNMDVYIDDATLEIFVPYANPVIMCTESGAYYEEMKNGRLIPIPTPQNVAGVYLKSKRS